jgi:N-acetylglucosamine-6-phosphate deacetylase
MRNNLIIKNCRLADQTDANYIDVFIQDGKISKIGLIKTMPDNIVILDAKGKIIAPGFIDVHIQGAGGSDVLDGNVEALDVISTTLARFGVTGFLATTVMKPENDNRHLQVLAENRMKDLGGAKILGIHLEGPFINPVKKGGISPGGVYPPSKYAFDEINDILGSSLKMMTIAPEMDGNLAIIDRLIKNNCIPAFGHSNATYEEALTGFKAGISHVTHIFNAMAPLHHREPGPLLAIFESDNITAQIISDGVHLHPRIVNYLYHTLDKNRCICITDGIQAIGLPEGKYIYNDREYESKDGSARYDDGTLIGTALSVGHIAARFQKYTGCNLATAIETITKNPAKLLGLFDRKGTIEIGKDADLVIMEPDFSIDTTIINGRVVFRKEED